MNTDNENENENDSIGPTGAEPAGDESTVAGERRPLGYWLRGVDALLTREFATAFEGEDVTRRDWMLLNLLSGDVDAPGAAERLARKGKRLRRLEDLGWAEEQGDGTWALTDEGRAARERLAAEVDGIRARVSGAVSPEDYATTIASLEAIARELGWDEASGFPRGRGFGRWGHRFGGPQPFRPEYRFGWGPNLHHGFESGRPGRAGGGPQHGRSFGDAWAEYRGAEDGCRGGHARAMHEHWHHGHGHNEPHRQEHAHHERDRRHHEHGHRGRGARKAERAYERGFAAGFGAAQTPADDAPGAQA